MTYQTALKKRRGCKLVVKATGERTKVFCKQGGQDHKGHPEVYFWCITDAKGFGAYSHREVM